MISQLLVAGDSWTFGSEIKDPNISVDIQDWDIKNNSYRIPKIWPTKLAKRIKTDVTNISYPAASNDRILRLTESWLYENYIGPKKDTSELVVIVGWTSPERKDFFYTDHINNNPNWTTIWPMQAGFNYIQPGMNDFFKNYVTFLWSEREAHNRYVHQVTSLQNLCKVHNIKLIMFQAFYDAGNGIHGAKTDVEFQDHISNNAYINSDIEKAKQGENHIGGHHHYSNELTKTMWDNLDKTAFVKETFLGFLKQQDEHDTHMTKTISGQHPNEGSHTLWARHLEKFIKEELQW